MACPDHVIDYVIIHELAHLKEMNHSHSFWLHVAEMKPNYKADELWLKQN
jgi:predicted metal-dependent hydrolase